MTPGSPGGDARFYGRRKGKALKPRQKELITTLLPRLSASPPPGGRRMDPSALFNRPMDALWLEIGFGGGEHLAHQAQSNPKVGLIGAEPFVNGVGKLLRLIDGGGVDNIRIHDGDVRPWIERLPDACLDRAFLLFPDPWPKRRHWKRRFVNRGALDALARVLKDGAVFRVASDHPVYQRHVMTVLPEHWAFTWAADGPKDWRCQWKDAIETRYAAKARREGRTPLYFTFRRNAR